MGHKDSRHEAETETDDEETTESDQTPSADKRIYFLGIPFYKLSYVHVSKRCITIFFLTFNGVTFLAGIAAVVISVWMLVDNKMMSRLIGQRLFVTILLLIGFLASFAAFTGIVGLVKKRTKLLSFYIACYAFFLCVIFVGAILSFWLFEEIINKVHGDMASSIKNYRSSDSAKEAWDNTHRYLKCCGIKSFKDWAKYRVNVPQSCCSSSLDRCLQMTESVIHKSGCLKSGALFLKSYIHTISISALFVCLILVSNVFLAFAIRGRLKRHRPNPT